MRQMTPSSTALKRLERISAWTWIAYGVWALYWALSIPGVLFYRFAPFQASVAMLILFLGVCAAFGGRLAIWYGWLFGLCFLIVRTTQVALTDAVFSWRVLLLAASLVVPTVFVVFVGRTKR